MAQYFGGIEAGGTKFVCAIGNNQNEILEEIRFPTGNPQETLQKAIEFFKGFSDKYPISSIGIGSFGPINLDTNSETFGYIASTSKEGWENTNFGKFISKELGVPIELDTDVNAAALAEYLYGVAQKLNNFIYLTIGTGIGGGAMVNRKLLHGLSHPEMGHCLIPKEPSDNYRGVCAYHLDKCFEGLASGPAIKERWNIPAEEMPQDHEAWILEAYYIALGLVNYITILSPEKIILGGSVMQQKQLFPLIRSNIKNLLNDYVHIPTIDDETNSFIVPASFGNNTGILGALALAKNAIS